MRSAVQLTSLREVVEYWQAWLARLDSEPDIEVAGQMACVVSNKRFDRWYAASRGQSVGFAAIFDLVADLETPIVRELSRPAAWQKVRALVRELAASQ